MARSGSGSGMLILTEGSLPPTSVERVTLTIKNWYVRLFFFKKKKKKLFIWYQMFYFWLSPGGWECDTLPRYSLSLVLSPGRHFCGNSANWLFCAATRSGMLDRSWCGAPKTSPSFVHDGKSILQVPDAGTFQYWWILEQFWCTSIAWKCDIYVL